jgi:uncharacterized membrane protein (DUF4010 family)
MAAGRLVDAVALDVVAFLEEFAVAAAIGGLVGVEREHRARDPETGHPDETVIAGVRTFPLVAIAGFLVAFLASETQNAFVLAAGIAGAFGTAFVFSYMRHRLGMSGMTTPMALIVTFLLGAIIGYGYVFEGVVIGVVATFLLVTKTRLHRFAGTLDDEEILSALQFITVLFILLPLTYDLQPGWLGQQWLGRGALVDPFVILLTVVFVSAISFVSFLIMRRLGPARGMEYSGLLGGLVNSEATTASLAQRAQDDAALVPSAVVAIVLASTTMFLRNLAIVAFADPSFAFLARLAPYAAPTVLVGIVAALRLGRGRARADAVAVRVRNPFAIGPALRFALIFAAVSVATSLAQRSFGEAGVYVAALGGFASAGPVVASLGTLVVQGQVPLGAAVRAALLAMAAGVVNKIFILRWTNREAYRRALPALGAMTVASLVAAALAFAI